MIRRFGFNLHSWPSERHLFVDYPVSKQPRYGSKTQPHPLLLQLLKDEDDEFESILDQIKSRSDLLSGIASKAGSDPLRPHWDNGWFPPLDACVLMHFLLQHNSKRYIEIGSGNSTIFANHAKRFGQLDTTITSIDPEPRQGIDELCTTICRSRLQDVDLTLFDELEKGDILFFDGSHIVFTDSDVTVFFLEVLPRLKPGVLVQVHDIFWPMDYPRVWGSRYYAEQYMLAMVFLYAPDKYRTLFASAYVSGAWPSTVSALTDGSPMWDVYGTSYWFVAR